VSDPIKLLRSELVAAGRREIARNRAHLHKPTARRFARKGRPALVLAVLLVLASGSAVAASALFGPPVRAGLVLTGGPKAGQVALAPLRVADPAGGLPWGVRVYTPRRAASAAAGTLSCVQIGRVLDNQLGVVGEDGAFGDDGLFHVLPVEPLTDCIHASTAILYPGYIPASAFTGAGSCVAPLLSGSLSPATSRRVVAGFRACPMKDLRLVVYGVANPGATSVRLTSSSRVVSERLVAANRGAFIFVLPAARVDASHGQVHVTFGR
jgi:hypothetical protein